MSVGADKSGLPEFGLALFDYQVACRSDGSTYTFSSVKELTGDHIWVTDISDAKLNDFMPGLSRIKSDAYCQTRFRTVQNDLGLVGLSPFDLVKILQSVFAWTVDTSRQYFNNFDSQADRLVCFDHTRLLPTQSHMKIVLQSALQRYCTLSTARTNFSLYTPPSKLFRAMGSIRVPVGGFRFNKVTERADLENESGPIAFVKVPAAFVQSHLLNMPCASFHGRLTDEGALWLSLPEYHRFSQLLGTLMPALESVSAIHFSTLKDRAALLEPGAGNQAKRLVREEVSYSLFMLFDGVLGSFLGHGSARPTLPEAYLASLARLQSLEAVRVLQEEGFGVSGYGGSRIALEVHPLSLDSYKRQHFINVIDTLRLMPPVTDFNVPYSEREGDYFSTAFSIACAGDARSMVELNHHILSTE